MVQQATAGIYSGILHYDPDDPTKVVGDLAERWTVSPDGKTYTFHLPQGRQVARRPALQLGRREGHLRPHPQSRLQEPEVRRVAQADGGERGGGGRQHRRRSSSSSPPRRSCPRSASAWCRVAAKHILAKYGDLNAAEAQIGTGPFKFKKYERGSVIEWERNPDYFIKGLPYLDGVKQFILVAGPTQLAAAKAQQGHDVGRVAAHAQDPGRRAPAGARTTWTSTRRPSTPCSSSI